MSFYLKKSSGFIIRSHMVVLHSSSPHTLDVLVRKSTMHDLKAQCVIYIQGSISAGFNSRKAVGATCQLQLLTVPLKAQCVTF